MPRTGLLGRDQTVAVLVDFQESYRRVLGTWEDVLRHVEVLLQGVALLGVPLLVTEQYSNGLGHTVSEASRWFAPGTPIVEKMTMSCCGAPAFMEHLRTFRRRQILVAGIEAHACVSQTVQELLALDYDVHVARDTIASRRAAFVEPAWDRMRVEGARATTVEQALLELVRTAEAPEFKQLQRLLKEL